MGYHQESTVQYSTNLINMKEDSVNLNANLPINYGYANTKAQEKIRQRQSFITLLIKYSYSQLACKICQFHNLLEWNGNL